MQFPVRERLARLRYRLRVRIVVPEFGEIAALFSGGDPPDRMCCCSFLVEQGESLLVAFLIEALAY